jgi:hypothetical protein
LIVDSSCPHTAEEPATFIEKMKVDFRIMMKIAARPRGHDMNIKQPAGIINFKQRSTKHAKKRTSGSASTTKK